jgi:hypothetical protein
VILNRSRAVRTRSLELLRPVKLVHEDVGLDARSSTSSECRT